MLLIRVELLAALAQTYLLLAFALAVVKRRLRRRLMEVVCEVGGLLLLMLLSVLIRDSVERWVIPLVLVEVFRYLLD